MGLPAREQSAVQQGAPSWIPARSNQGFPRGHPRGPAVLPLRFVVEVAKCPPTAHPTLPQDRALFLAEYTATWNTDFSEVPLQLELATGLLKSIIEGK